jgi:hypothetical protein
MKTREGQLAAAQFDQRSRNSSCCINMAWLMQCNAMHCSNIALHCSITLHSALLCCAAVEQCLPKLGSAVSGGSGGTTGRAITPPSSSGCADTGDARSDGQQPRPVPAAAVTGQGHKQCSGGVPSTPGSGGSGAATSTHMHAIGGGGSGSGAGTGGGSAGAPARGGGAAGCAVLSREEGGGAGGARAAQSTLQLSPDSTTGPAGPLLPVLPSAVGGGPLHSLAAQQQQQQQQCHKRRREDGDLAQVLLLGSDAQRSRKEGGMVVA